MSRHFAAGYLKQQQAKTKIIDHCNIKTTEHIQTAMWKRKTRKRVDFVYCVHVSPISTGV